jgi:replicative DNA helicase Mcm
MTGESLRRSVLTACIDALKKADLDVEGFVEQYPEETDTFEIPLDELPHSVRNDWYKHPDLFERHFQKALGEFTEDTDKSMAVTTATVRVVGYDEDEVFDVGQYQPDDVAERMIHIRGQVTERSKRNLRDEKVAFECQRCGQVNMVKQRGEGLDEPTECDNCERNGPFHENQRKSVMRDFQVIRFQTLPEETDDADPDSITLRLYDDLVGSLRPGDRAVVNAVIRPRRKSSNSRVKILEGDVKSIELLTADHSDIEVEPYREDIEAVVEADDTYEQVIRSVAPFHEGDHTVKEGIALALFGGITKDLPDGGWMRGNSHILLMGDPGTGKTALCRYVAELVPRSEYATGKMSTGAGLTAGAVKNDFGEEGWTLQAGTLVKANKGIAVIDELDKMDREDRDGIVEAMSEQEITVQKIVSGILPAETSVLAAANPKYGTFDPMTDISQQLDLADVLLSRFDLWFLLRDQPDEEKDEAVASSMTGSARAGQKLESGKELDDEDIEEIDPPIPPEMFRAYVALAKQHYPVFTDEADNRIVEEYVDIRQINEDNDDGPIPTTARMVEALIRLSEAAARIRLGDEIIVEDVERAIDIMYESLETLGIDPETGELDAARMETGKSSSRHDREKAIVAIVESKSSKEEDASYEDVKEEAMAIMDPPDFETTLEKMLSEGRMMEPRSGTLRVP